jgi:hypothetical protein
MKKRLIIFLSFIIVLGISLLSVAQFTPEELAERAKWEDFLATAEVVGQVQMGGREAVTEPWRLTLEKDGIKRDAIWKNIEGRTKTGYPEGWKWEIAAYRMDKLLGLNMVPPTVEKRFREDRGSCQLWMEDIISLKQKEDKKMKVPSYRVGYWNRATYLQRAFDNLIANVDRHQNQILITKDWRMILIDHSRSFRTGKDAQTGTDLTKNLIYTEKHKEGPKLMSELPRAFVEKLKALNFEMIKDAVGEYLTDKEIDAVLARRELIIKEIERLIAKNGEANVLYD